MVVVSIVNLFSSRTLKPLTLEIILKIASISVQKRKCNAFIWIENSLNSGHSKSLVEEKHFASDACILNSQ